MSFTITGLPTEEFTPLFSLSNDELARRGILRKTASSKPGFPCRITLEDAEPGESLLLLNYESHQVDTPYRSSYAIYVREGAVKTATFTDQTPPVFRDRPIALRFFNKDGHLLGADLSLKNDSADKIQRAFDDPQIAYIHAHNAAHGCFAAEIRRSD